MTQAEGPLNKSTILGLAAMALAVLVVANDHRVKRRAPGNGAGVRADVTTVQWVINGYALVFGVLIVTGGRLADMFGGGGYFFSARSYLRRLLGDRRFRAKRRHASGLPGSDGCRRRDDVAGHPGHDLRDLAPEQSGLSRRTDSGCGRFRQRDWTPYWCALTDALSWRWIFFLNLPIAVFAMLVTWRVVRADEGTLSDHRVRLRWGHFPVDRSPPPSRLMRGSTWAGAILLSSVCSHLPP